MRTINLDINYSAHARCIREVESGPRQ